MIYSDNRWVGKHGIGRYASEVLKRIPYLRSLVVRGKPLSALDPIRLKLALERQNASAFYSPAFNAPLATKVPCILTVHDLIHLEDPHQSTLFKKSYYEFIVKPALVNAPFVFTVSQASQMKIAAWSGISSEKIIITPNGVSPIFTLVKTPIKTEGGFFVYVGSSKPHKNTERMLRAFALLKSEGLNLIWIGPISDRDYALIENLNIKHLVKCHLEISDKELHAMYSSSLGNIFPSTIEGFGLPPLECILSGKPALISSTNPLLDDISALTEVADPLSINDIAAGMRRLAHRSISDPSSIYLIETLRDKYNWDRTAQIASENLNKL